MKKLITVLIIIYMLVAAIPTVYAAEAENNFPFVDVKENDWFYDAVKYSYEGGIFKGTNSNGTTFSPGRTMTRIEFATTLFRLAGAKETDYQGNTGFPDVPAGSWMSAPAKWASEKGYVKGNDKGEFMPTVTLDRQTLATMLYRFANDYFSTDDSKQTALAKFNDAGSCADWAKEAVTWATTVELINGTGNNVNGAPTLAPVMSASRAQVAQILKNYLTKNLGGEYPVGSFTLGGSDVSEFVIVYGATETYEGENHAETVAQYVQSGIKNAVGIDLPVYSDTDYAYTEGAKEILIGKTNREDMGVVSLDREGFGNYTYLYEMQGDHLILASNEVFVGTYYAANMFLCDILGVKYFGQGLFSYTSIKNASIDDGVCSKGDTYYEYTSNFIEGGDDPFLGNFGESVFVNSSHNLPALACNGECGYEGDIIGYGHHLEHYLGSNPCLTADDKIDTIIKNVGLNLKEELGEEKDKFAIVWLNQDDSSTFCKCEQCMAAYRVWGRSAPYVQILTYVSDYYSAEYPNVHYASFSYRHTKSAPYTVDEINQEDYNNYMSKYGDHKYVASKDITPPENCIVFVKTDDTACASHAKTDPDCPRNVDYVTRMSGWCKIFKNVCLHQFATGDSFAHTVFPNIYSTWQEYDFINEYPQVTWLRTCGQNGDSADFETMRAYLHSRMYYDHDMTWNEYSNMVNEYLKAAYGPGWGYIREYIDITEKLSEENHWWSYNSGITSAWNKVITEEQWRSEYGYGYISDLFDKAYALCDTDEQRKSVEITSMCIRYIECQLAYSDYKASGSEKDFEKYTNLSSAYIAKLNEFGLKAPEDWEYNQDPNSWHKSS
ncbi:MAG: DUF4838 domain-containing protein [Clostridia bacterium]|nr:DUF4838 domain-containing protein [Clostridia bacterium]